VNLSELQISELNTLVQNETSGFVERKPPPSDTTPANGGLRRWTADQDRKRPFASLMSVALGIEHVENRVVYCAIGNETYISAG
jgi:hypothetical protein